MTMMLLAALLSADARPTAADVATAVQLSKAQYTEKHSPVSQDRINENIARQKMATVVQTLTRTQNIPNEADRSAAVKQASGELERLRREVADAVGKRQNIPVGKELDAIDVSRLSIGSVGHLRCCDDVNGFTARCERVLGPDRSVVRITQYGPAGRRRSSPTTDGTGANLHRVPRVYATIVLKGYSTTGLHAGSPIKDLDVDLVMVGRDYLGRTLPVLEVFDPEQPFK